MKKYSGPADCAQLLIRNFLFTAQSERAFEKSNI